MASLHLTNRTTTNISLVGDNGKPRVEVPYAVGGNTATVDVADLKGNTLLISSIASLITSSKLTVRYGTANGTVLTAADMDNFLSGNPYDLEGVRVAVKVAGIDVTGTTLISSVQLPGTSAQRFMPQAYFFICRTANTVAGDGTLNVGSASGGTQLLNGQALTGLNLVNEVFRVDVAGTAAATPMAGDGTIYAQMAGADSTAVAGTVDMYVEGVFL